MKNIKIVSICVLTILLSGCGYKQINEKSSNIIYLQNIVVTGAPRIAYSIKNNILLISNEDSKNRYTGKIKIDKIKTSKIKNSTGKVVRYNLLFTTELELTNIDDKNKIKKSFTRTGDFDVASIHSDTISNENNITKRLIQQLSDDITNFITLAIRKP